MQIQKSSRGDLLTLTVEGVLDNDTAIHFRDAIDEQVRAGWHRVLLDLNKVPYLSSAAISVLLAARKQLDQLHGLFGVCNLAPEVEQVLHQTRVLSLLFVDPKTISMQAARGSMTMQVEAKLSSDHAANYELYRQQPATPFRGQLLGQADRIRTGAFSKQDCQTVQFPQSTFGIGLGALGVDFEMSRSRFGEFLAVGGAVAKSPMSNSGLPDYMVSQEDYIPDVQVLYGLKCSADFSHLMRFEARDPAEPLGLSSLVAQALKTTEAAAAGIVVLAECDGLVGTRLRKSPVEAVPAGTERFDYPQVREWLSYGAEKTHRRSLALLVGVAQQADRPTALSGAKSLLRPLDGSGRILGHFHAAVFPYRPLKKRTLDLDSLVQELFSSGSIQDVLHLLNDDRPVMGAGESTFVTGGCWVSPIGADAMLEELT